MIDVGQIEWPARSLPLEIEDDIGERIAFQNVVLDFKWTRLRFTVRCAHMDGILPRLPPGGEIRNPERETCPVVDVSRRLQIANIDRFGGAGIHKFELLRLILGGSSEYGLLGLRGFVADLIHQYADLTEGRRRARSAQ